jgi:penicillin-binding protein 1A
MTRPPAHGADRPARPAHQPTVARAAAACLLSLLVAARLLAVGLAARRRLRAARVALGAAVAAHFSGQPAPAFLAGPLAAHRAAAARLAATAPPTRRPSWAEGQDPRRAGGQGPPGTRPAPGGAADRGRPVATPPVTPSRASRSAGGDPFAAATRLGAALVRALPRLLARARLRAAEGRLGALAAELADLPEPLTAARGRAAGAGWAVAEADAERAASRRAAAAEARLALALAGEALAGLFARARSGLRSGSSMFRAWLLALAVAGRRRLVIGAATTGRGVAAGGRGGAAVVRWPAAAGGAVLAACAALAGRIDVAVERRRARRATTAPPPPAPAGREAAAGANGRWPGQQPARLTSAGEADGPWWLPSNLAGEQPAPARQPGAHARRGRLGTLRAFGRRTGRRLAPVVGGLAAPPDRRHHGWFAFVRPVAAALALAVLLGTVAALPAGLVVADTVKAASGGLPDLDELKPLAQPERTQIYDRNGRLIEVLHDEQDRIVVPLSQVPQAVRQAVIAAEDERFYQHHGVDDRGILRAAITNLLRGQTAQGGSTITQQLVRQAYPDLKDRSIARKVKEAALAAQLEGRLTKDQILQDYLNRVYFGSGYYGVEAASRGYFRKTVGDLDLAQAATLAGIIRSPETANPRSSAGRARELRDSVLDRMAALGMISSATAAKAKREPFKAYPPRRLGGSYPWFVDGLKRQLLDDPRLGRTERARYRELYEGGLRIYTTLDRDMQAKAEDAVRRWRPKSGPDIALVAIDPRDGQVRAVVGGRNYKRNKYNVAVQGQGRQVGSSFKPFVLATALQEGISPDSVWESAPFQSDDVCGSPWKVDNYEGGGSGKISVREATWRSVNGVYARLMERLCPDKVIDMAKRLGITADLPHVPSIALGSADIRPIDMASAYATFADGGVYHKPTFVTEVKYHGRTVFQDQPVGERRIPEALAWQVTDILKGVIAHGTGVAANIGRPEAGKTGTNQNYQDAWFVGYTPELAAAVWMGDPDKQVPMLDVNGIRVTGGSYPARVWHDFMLPALSAVPPSDWQQPPDQLHYDVLPPPSGQPGGDHRRRKKKRPGGGGGTLGPGHP